MSAVADLVGLLPWWLWLVLGAPVLFVIVIAILLALPKKMSKKRLPNGMEVWQWNNGETDYLYGEIFKDDLYTSRDVKLEAGATVFDCGANIGMFALYAHHKTGGDVQVHSFEPMPKIYGVLAANARKFGNDHLHAYQVGLSDAPAQVEFEFHPHFSIWSTSNPDFDKDREARVINDLPAILSSAGTWLPNFLLVPLSKLMVKFVLNKTEKVKAELTTLSRMIEKTGVSKIDLLKIDVEGAEVQVIKGIEDRHWPMIQQVVLEAEDFKAVQQLKGLLTARGFKVTSFASEREKVEGLSSEVSCVMAVRP